VESRPELASRFIFITGHPVDPATANFLDETRAPVLNKPFSIATLLETLRGLSADGSAAGP